MPLAVRAHREAGFIPAARTAHNPLDTEVQMPTVIEQFDETKSFPKRIGAHLRLVKTPSFLIIGAQKAGTSSLHSILSQHPQLMAGSRKELKYFNSGFIPYGDKIAYSCCFPFRWKTRGRQTFEATPGYMLDPECPQRMRHFNPNLKLIAILREPIARAYSAWSMYRRMGKRSDTYFTGVAESRSFEDAISQELATPLCTSAHTPASYLERGVYARQLNRVCRFFELNKSLKVIFYEEFFADVASGSKELFRFLKVRDDFEPQMSHSNRGDYEMNIEPDLRQRAADFFLAHNAALAGLLGRELPWNPVTGGVDA